ncbi:Subtilisin-like protease [Acorus calamus]|uniref:Subtilisin-like protease n=1 Tax=Acorus calamus TaxID=4465 RepID=A0AAV9EDD3_ACOCL|nr:Subtilisin-like protease [Acorus calamus]
MEENPNVVSVFPDGKAKLLTTQSWDFVGLERGGRVPEDSLWLKSRKLIGAKYYYKGFAESEPIDPSLLSARDSEGHGTHTLSTAAGRFVPGANTFGFAKGTAKGGSPDARVAAYKVCWPGFLGGGCANSDMMAAVDDAINDGVDVLSMSIGGGLIIDYSFDSTAVATFHAVANGVTVVLAGGNSGPALGFVSNIAPWMITVAASSIDRSTYCSEDALDLTQVKGKIVACKGGENFPMVIADMISKAGGVGMILANNGNDVIVDPYMSPATTLAYEDGLALYDYINSTKNPTAYIMPGRTTLHTKPAPVMANFSSQGPNWITPDILKVL